MLAWDEASNLRFGPAASYAVILFLYVGIAAWVFVKLLDADVISDARDRTRQLLVPARKPVPKPEAVPA
jgi:multiple sugar transport system permease protein